jgi:DNA-binding SARP family transcriptional activator/tetratricopeptide (TPR) repeat protein
MIDPSDEPQAGCAVLRVLGRVDIRTAPGRPATALLAQSKRLAFLTVLALDHGARRDSLFLLFWPDSDDSRARHALNQTVYKIRRALGAESITSNGPEQLDLADQSLWCDAVAFERMLDAGRDAEALSLYAGDLMPGFHVADAPEFEEWLSLRRHTLRSRARGSAQRLAVGADTAGDWTSCVRWSRRALDIDTGDETMLRMLLNAHVHLGERGVAMSEYRAFAERLEREYGIQPSIETTELAHTVADVGTGRSPRSSVADPGAPNALPAIAPAQVELVRGRTTAAELDGPASPQAIRVHGRSKWRLQRVLVTVGLPALILAVLGTWVVRANRTASPLDPRRVIVAPLINETGQRELDAIGNWAADWITMGLQASGILEVVDPVTGYITRARLPERGDAESDDRTLALARAVGAGTLVWGRYRLAGDSLHVSVRISDVRSGVRRSTLAASGTVSEASKVLQSLRSSVAGALAGQLDSRIATLQSTPSNPPTLEAYRAYVAGLDLFVRSDYEEAVPRFLQSAALDSTFMLPRFWALFALENSGQGERFDSMIATLVPSRDRLSPLDQSSLDFLSAWGKGDHLGSFTAARRAARLAPQSNWTYLVAMLAPDFARPQEAVSAAEALSPGSGWAVGWPVYWRVKAKAYHTAGEHEKELRTIAEGERQVGPLPIVRARALAALGRVDAITAMLDSMAPDLPLRARIAYEAGMELRAHNHGDAAKPFQDRSISAIAQAAAESPDDPDLRRTHGQYLYFAGRWREAERILEPLMQLDSVHYDTYVMLAYAAAHRADTARAWALVENLKPHQIHARKGTLLFVHACIWALLGNRDEAVRYIRESLDAGYNWTQLHQDINLESLRDYPPFLEATRPKDPAPDRN